MNHILKYEFKMPIYFSPEAADLVSKLLQKTVSHMISNNYVYSQLTELDAGRKEPKR
jgi:hypothetical protein